MNAMTLSVSTAAVAVSKKNLGLNRDCHVVYLDLNLVTVLSGIICLVTKSFAGTCNF